MLELGLGGMAIFIATLFIELTVLKIFTVLFSKLNSKNIQKEKKRLTVVDLLVIRVRQQLTR